MDDFKINNVKNLFLCSSFHHLPDLGGPLGVLLSTFTEFSSTASLVSILKRTIEEKFKNKEKEMIAKHLPHKTRGYENYPHS